jgi:DNA-binding transcriptional LysR family regulator
MIARFHDGNRSRFSMGFVPSTLYGKLPEVIRGYRAARPDVDLSLLEMTSVEQIAGLKEGRIDVGFGRIPFDDPALERQLLRNEKLLAAVPSDYSDRLRGEPLGLADLAAMPLIVYPRAPRPSYADQVLSLFRGAGLKPPLVHEVRELQTALGLVAAGEGVCLVPASVETLRRDHVTYRKLDAAGAVSPIIMSSRKGDRSPELTLILKLIKQMYRKDGIVFGT